MKSYQEFLDDVDYWLAEAKHFEGLPFTDKLFDDKFGFVNVFRDDLVRRNFYDILAIASVVQPYKIVALLFSYKMFYYLGVEEFRRIFNSQVSGTR